MQRPGHRIDADINRVKRTEVDDMVSGLAQVDAFHTFGLPQNAPVFNLPAGFSADAPSIGMVDNVIATAPEPVPVGRRAVGLMVVWGLRRRGQSA
jgi:hypothetical protein